MTKERKEEIIKTYRLDEKDTGSPEVQIALLTERINDTGVYDKYGGKWNCWYYTDYHVGHGYLNVSQAIKHSCIYFFYEIGYRARN